MILSLPLKFFLAIILGAVIGLERESAYGKEFSEKKFNQGSLGGIRTFSLISLLGAIAGYLSFSGNFSIYLIITIGFFVLISIYYLVGSNLIKSTGLTTELAAVYAFLIGLFLTSEILPIQLVVALSVVLSLIMSIKKKIKSFALGIKRTEIDAFLGFAIIALVILPFLPNESYTLLDVPGIETMLGTYHVQAGFLEQLEIINPYKLWFIVALITGIDVFGYLLGKLAGQKQGWIMTSAVGGFISSTSTTQSLAQRSKEEQHINQLVSAAVIANLTSFFQVFVLVAPLNSEWLVKITPTLMLIILSAVGMAAVYIFKRKKGKEMEGDNKGEIKERAIFSLGPALKFAVILVVIRAVTKVSLAFFGQAGFLVSSIIASFSGIDAIVINLAEIAGGAVAFKAALFTLICVNATNLLSKAVYAFFQGKKEFAWKFLLSVSVIVAASFVGYILA